MTPEAQRIAIAEACGTLREGWWCPKCEITVSADKVTYYQRHDEGYGGCGSVVEETGPDYLNDLNAMHEAEETLNENRRLIYSRALVDNFRGLGWQFDVIHATSAQRAEAFLKTLGLWKD